MDEVADAVPAERNSQRLDNEVQFHLDQQIAENIAAGMSPQEARHAAIRTFGNPTFLKEETRDAWGWIWLQQIGQDSRYGLRTLARDRRFVLLAILALALGIGSTTLAFSVIYSVLFHPLPYKNSDRLAVFRIQDLANGDESGRTLFSIPEFLTFREQNHVFEDLVAYSNDVSISYNDGKGSRDILGTLGTQSHSGSGGAYVTTNTFKFYGMPPLLGRGITERDGDPDAPAVFVMNYTLWREMFSADPNVLGKTFVLNDESRVCVGIMPPRFQAYGANIWLPLSLKSGVASAIQLKAIGRLKPGITAESAAADLTVVARQFLAEHPKEFPAGFTVMAETFEGSLVRRFKASLYELIAAVSMLLLIACTNVAHLLLARATTRQREMAVRASLGATRNALVRQLIVETFLLAAAGCTLGCFIAYGSLKWFIAMIPAHRLPDEVVVKLDPVVLVFAIVVSMATAAVCGLVPALHSVSGDLQIRLAGRGTEAFRHGRLRNALVIAQVALSLVLLVGAGLMLRSVLALTHINLGFNPQQVLYLRLDLPNGQYQTVAQRKILFEKVLENVKALPGVVAAAETWSLLPLDFKTTEVGIPGKAQSEPLRANLDLCSEGYFQVLGLKLLRGRLFSTADVVSGRRVAVINDTLARNFFANEDPIGQKIKLNALDRLPDAPHDAYFEIVGVVADFKNRGLEDPVAPEVILPNTISGFGTPIILARTPVSSGTSLKSAYDAVWAASSTIAINMSGSLQMILNEYVLEEPRFEYATFGAFAGIGLLLVLTGTFSVIGYNVSLHTHDIGVRMAVGAKQSDVTSFFLKQGLVLIGVGILIGVLTSLALTHFLMSQLRGISPTDPWAFAVAVACMVAVGLVACYLPARQASRVDPMVALRYE